MQRILWLLIFFLLIPIEAELKTIDLEKFVDVASPVIFKKIAVYPVYYRQKELDFSLYITLDEGTKKKLVIITEKGRRPLNDQERSELAQLQRERQNIYRKYGRYMHFIQGPQVQQVQQRQIFVRNYMNRMAPARNANPAVRIENRNPSKFSSEDRKKLEKVRKKFWQIEQRIRALSGTSATVNALSIENRSDKKLYIMAGEMVIGGKQDRIIGEDTIILPGQRTTIPVFCVEKGRWSYRVSQSFKGYNVLANNRLRGIAQMQKDQSAVWREVARVNKKLKTTNRTSTYRANYNSKEVGKKLENYMQSVSKDPRFAKATGVVIAIEGKVVGADIFAHSRLFQKVFHKLLRSYCLEAIASPERRNLTTPSMSQVRKLFYDLKAPSKLEKKGKNYHNFIIKGKIFNASGAIGINSKGKKKLLHLNCHRK